MKNIILIVILLLLQNVFAEAQIFKGTPKKLSDLNFYPKPNGYPSAKIISISELNLPDVEKVFPKAKLCDIFMEGQSFVGIEKSHGYYLLYKGKYYSDFSYLSQIEQKANKNKLSTYSLKERVEAYTTVAFYKYLKGEVKVDSITYIEIADNGNGGKVLTYNFDFKVNDINYNGTIEIDDKEWITHIYIIQINRGANFASFYTKTKSLLNFINADNSEYYNNISHYYFKVEDNSNDVKIEINGLDPNEEVQCLFVDYINHSTVYETKNIIAGTNGKAYYHYFQDPVITGVYCIRVMRNNSSPILDYSKAFIPEHRLEANLSTGLNTVFITPICFTIRHR